MMMRYSPFEKEIDELRGEDLVCLRSVSEGWYVEYKSQMLAPKDYAKSLSAFANQYGGWLFFGIKGLDRDSRVAQEFPGIPIDQVVALEGALRDASKDSIHPSVYYEHTVIRGPVAKLSLPEERSIVIVRIPMGSDPPYVHTDGRIYRRIADSSSPVHEKDRHILDMLWNRGQTSRAKLRSLITQHPDVSQTEKWNPFLHLFISSDPLEQSGRPHLSRWADVVRVMKGDPIPFDSIYSRSGGFIARQTKGNPLLGKLLTWEFHREGHSIVTIPISFIESTTHVNSLRWWLEGNERATDFIELLSDSDIGPCRILDLNSLLGLLTRIVARHRELFASEGCFGPFYAKAHIEGIWRCIPFIDTTGFIHQLRQDGIPVVQESEALCPPDDHFSSFALLPTPDTSLSRIVQYAEDVSRVLVPVLLALGVSATSLQAGAEELFHIEERALDVQRRRNSPAIHKR